MSIGTKHKMIKAEKSGGFVKKIDIHRKQGWTIIGSPFFGAEDGTSGFYVLMSRTELLKD